MRGATWMLAMLLAGSGQAQEAGPVSAAFTWSALDLSTLEMPDGQEAYTLESLIAVAPETKGPLSGLRGRCLLSGVRDPGAGRYAASGVCVHTDGDGDRLVMHLTEGAEGGGALATGVGRWAGGTGKFAGASGEISYSLVSYGLQRPGTHEGNGRAHGILAVAGAGPAEPSAEPPPLQLRRASPPV